MSAIWESANWTRQFGIQQTGNRQFGMLPKTHLIINIFTCMALLSLQSIKIPILLIDTGSFYYTYAFTFNTSFITLMNDTLKGKANG